MLTRRLPRSVLSSSFNQPVSHSTRWSRLYATERPPTIADIKPQATESFNERQAEFRKRLTDEAEAKKRQEIEESRSKAAASAEASSPPGASILGSTLGSLSSSFADEARAREDAISGKKAGPLTTLIYGTQEGREMDQEIERSFSQVLARGKYVHSIVFHDVETKNVDKYVETIGKWYPSIANSPATKVNLVGSWRTEVGDVDTFGKTNESVYKTVYLTYT
jgi:hypothetical protein